MSLRLHVRVARKLIEEHGITTRDLWKPYTYKSGAFGQTKEVTDYGIDDNTLVWDLIDKRVRRMRPAVMGVMIWTARGISLYGVHCGTWLSKNDSGRNLMRDIARTTIMATLMELVPKPARSERALAAVS